MKTTIDEAEDKKRILELFGIYDSAPDSKTQRMIQFANEKCARVKDRFRALADDSKNEPKIFDGKHQDWDSTKDPQFAPEIEEQIKKRESQNDNALYNQIWFARDFRSGARFAIQLLQSKLKELL